MDKVYDHKKIEESLYDDWEKKGYFKPEINPEGEPYSIILPPPNANAPLHFGHAMYVVEDILIRHHRMKGFKTLWEPGADHAGFETQFVYEKKLAEKGKTRFDFDRETLFKDIWDYVHENRGGMESQLRKLGFSLDWSRLKFTMDPEIVKIVYHNFKKLYDDGLVYRAKRLVNYCTYDGTSFSDLEVVHEERKSPLYYIKYGPLTLATTRPETKFGDTALAVHPKDSRYKELIGKEIEIETVLGKAKILVVADEMVDPEFGTGVVKITPAHDFNDFEVAQRHNLPMKQVIGFDGKMNDYAGEFSGLYVKQARKAVVAKMQEKGLIEKIDENYQNRVGLCYKCKNILEPLPKEQWFIKMEPLAKPAIEAVKSEEIKIYPKNYEKLYFQFLENIRDWNISRQVVWGIQIPAWKNKTTGEWRVTEGEVPEGNDWERDGDTFDTWFSSSQWPFATLMSTKEGDYDTFYPTTVMETGYDILRWWVARMVMMGIYATGKVPFKNVVLHGLVNDPLGKKMSKSKGNVVNPLELVDEYGADAVRFALVYGTALGNDQILSYPKLEAARRFTNKLWNIGRFIQLQEDKITQITDVTKLDRNIKGQVLTADESRKLVKSAKKGNQEAKKVLRQSVIASAYTIIKNFEGLGVSQEILLQRGVEAFDVAFEKYDEISGIKFSTYAMHFIRQRIIDELGGLEIIAQIEEDKEWIKKIINLQEEVTKYLDGYQINLAADRLYDFIWHEFADKYVEDVKNRITPHSYSVLLELFIIQLKLLHPIMPYVTDEIYRKLGGEKDSIMIEKWPITS